MNVAWNTQNYKPTDEPISRLLELTSMLDDSSDGDILGVISSVEGQGYLRCSLSLAYGCVFDELLLNELKDVASLLESELTEKETRQITEGEKELGNSGSLSKVREDFFSVLITERLLKILLESITKTTGDIEEVEEDY